MAEGASSKCWICGVSTPHNHTPETVEAFRVLLDKIDEAHAVLMPFAEAWEAAMKSGSTNLGELGALSAHHLNGPGPRFRRAAIFLVDVTKYRTVRIPEAQVIAGGLE